MKYAFRGGVNISLINEPRTILRVDDNHFGIRGISIGMPFVAMDSNTYKWNMSEMESDNMNKKLNGYKEVAAIEIGYSMYYYAIFDDGTLYKEGDKVVVSGRASGQVLTIEEILTVEEAERAYSGGITEEVIARIDTVAYDKRVEARKTKDELKKKMDKIIKEMDESKKYELYAESNPALKEVLEQYKALAV